MEPLQELVRELRLEGLHKHGGQPCAETDAADRIERLLPEIEKRMRNDILEEAYLIARGGERFKELGTKQLYWKGRCDAATEIRAAKTK